MTIPTKKLQSGFEIPIFGIGTWEMGGRMEYDPSNDDERDITAIRTAINTRITHIDTAEKYAAGYSEILVGKAIEGYDRSALFIATKVASQNLRFDDLISSCKASLKRINTEYFDLYMIHSPSLAIPIEESMRAMDTLVADGLIKNIGVSNFSVERFQKAQDSTKNKIVVNQLHYNLLIREPERRGILDYCQRNDVMFVAYRPIQKGLLVESINPLLENMCKKYDKTPAQIAINWLTSQKNVVTLSKMSNQKHLEENLGALEWKMEDDDIEKLRNDFPNQQDISDSVPLTKYD